MLKYILFFILLTFQTRVGANQLASRHSVPTLSFLNVSFKPSVMLENGWKMKNLKKILQLPHQLPKKWVLITGIVLLPFAITIGTFFTIASYQLSAPEGMLSVINFPVVLFGILTLLCIFFLVRCIIRLRKKIKNEKKRSADVKKQNIKN